jgi:hypothetical protein
MYWELSWVPLAWSVHRRCHIGFAQKRRGYGKGPKRGKWAIILAQSSGMGKSRLLDEYGKICPVVNFILRPEGSSYRCGGDEFRDWSSWSEHYRNTPGAMFLYKTLPATAGLIKNDSSTWSQEHHVPGNIPKTREWTFTFGLVPCHSNYVTTFNF